MNRFYEMGKTAALQKLGQGGILRQLGTAARSAYRGLSPEATRALHRAGAGAGLGAAGGTAADDFSARGIFGGAALGAGAGLAAHKGLDFLKHRGHMSGAKQLDLLRYADAQQRHRLAKDLIAEMTPQTKQLRLF